jgi:hypothetical protein
MRGTSTFKKSDVTRAIKAALAAGVELMRVEVGKDGRIILFPGKPLEAMEVNEWDAVVKNGADQASLRK